MRRIKTLLITAELLRDFLRNPARPELRYRVSGLPDDARFVGASWQEGHAIIALTVESASFPTLEPEEIPPILDPLVFTVTEIGFQS